MNPIVLICAIASFISCFEACFSEAVLALRLDEMGLNEFLIGLYYCIYGVSCIISTFMVSYFTDKYEIRGIIWKSMLLCGFTCFLVGPSEYLPNSIVLMGIGETLNGLLLAFFMTTCLPVMIEEGERMHPHRKLEVADKCSAIANCTLEIGQALGPIYGSYMFVLIGFRNTADTIAFLLIGYSIIFFIVLTFVLSLNSDKSESLTKEQLKQADSSL